MDATIDECSDESLLPIHIFMLGRDPDSELGKRLKKTSAQTVYAVAKGYSYLDVCQSLDVDEFEAVCHDALLKLMREARNHQANGPTHPHYETANQVRGAIKQRIDWAAKDFYADRTSEEQNVVHYEDIGGEDREFEPKDEKSRNPEEKNTFDEIQREVARGGELFIDKLIPLRAEWFRREDWRANFTEAADEMLAIARGESTLDDIIDRAQKKRDDDSRRRAATNVHKRHQRARDKIYTLLRRLPTMEQWDEWEMTTHAYVGMWRSLLELRQRQPKDDGQLDLPPEAAAAARRAGRKVLEK